MGAAFQPLVPQAPECLPLPSALPSLSPSPRGGVSEPGGSSLRPNRVLWAASWSEKPAHSLCLAPGIFKISFLDFEKPSPGQS